jgi:IS605 OrfB family transposase
MPMQTLTLKLPFLALNRAKREEFEELTRLNTVIANRIVALAPAERAKLTSKHFTDIDIGSAWINQTIRNARARTGVRRFRRLPLEVNNQNWNLHRAGVTFSVSFTLRRGRTRRIPLMVHQAAYFEVLAGLLAGSVRKGTLKLWCSRRGLWYALISVSMDVPEARPIQGWVGVDRGQNHLAVASLPTGQARYWTFGQIRQLRRRFARRRQQLQAAGKRHALKRMEQRERRIMRHIDHIVSKQIVGFARDHSCGIRLEDLTGILRRVRQRRIHRSDAGRNRSFWPFHQLETMIRYKAILAGVSVEKVPPAYTSKTCRACRALGERKRHAFCCPRCGFQGQSDWVASQNIGGWVGLSCPLGLQKAGAVVAPAVRGDGVHGTPPNRVSSVAKAAEREPESGGSSFGMPTRVCSTRNPWALPLQKRSQADCSSDIAPEQSHAV